MITVTVFKKNGEYTGFRAKGHADYAEEGSDIFCAAVSVLTIHTANAIAQIAGANVESEERDGFLSCSFPAELGHDGTVLMDAMVMSLRQISESSGKPYVRLNIKEV